jgi:hypothetical protein
MKEKMSESEYERLSPKILKKLERHTEAMVVLACVRWWDKTKGQWRTRFVTKTYGNYFTCTGMLKQHLDRLGRWDGEE